MKDFSRLIMTFVILLLVSQQLFSQKLRIATYNIRVDVEADAKKGDGWEQRCPKICDIIKLHDFEIFGLQEAKSHQLKGVLSLLPGYSAIGVARDDGKERGEYSPIVYKNERFRLLDNGTFWLAPDPSKPALGWDAACIRICTWGKFKDKESGFVFWMFNTHMDHIGVVARIEGARLIINKIKEITGSSENVLISGDFNVDQKSDVYEFFKNAWNLKDSYEITPFRLAWTGTMNNFDPDMISESRIDHIFVGPGFKVLRYGILTDSYRTIISEEARNQPNFPKEMMFRKSVVRFPSDHYPVMIEVSTER
ncbi:MAG: endonuclease/exonuclease/phosphatase family protein [Bacteroidales bacterium]|nr:endonuclease/exonuclease/phosphatase family protein [Bacteroidales bacterium]